MTQYDERMSNDRSMGVPRGWVLLGCAGLAWVVVLSAGLVSWTAILAVGGAV